MAVYEVSYTVKDGNPPPKNTASSKFNLGGGLTIAEADAEAQGIIELIDDMTDGQIVDVSINYKPDISGWSLKSAPTTMSNRQMKARFIWNVLAGAFTTRMTVPARKESIVIPSSEIIDTSTGGAPGTLFKVGFLAATTTDERGEAVTSLAAAKEVFE